MNYDVYILQTNHKNINNVNKQTFYNQKDLNEYIKVLIGKDILNYRLYYVNLLTGKIYKGTIKINDTLKIKIKWSEIKWLKNYISLNK